MKALVTGSSGKLGQAVAECLRHRQADCIGIDLTGGEHTDQLVDIGDRQALRKVLRGITVIIHTAALHGRHVDLACPQADFIRTNVSGTLNLIEEGRECGARRFIYTGTTSVYGEAMVNPEQAVWVDEELHPVPRDIYDVTKLAAEQLCRIHFDRDRFQTCVLRVSRFMDEPANLVANYRLYRGLDEADGAQAHWLAALKEHEKFEIYNISNRSPFGREDLPTLKRNPQARLLQLFPNAGRDYRRLGWNMPSSIDRVYCIDKAESLLGYRPLNNFAEYLDAQLDAAALTGAD